MIPKIIHQSNKKITNTVKASGDSIKQTHPDWEYRFWSDDDVRGLIESHFPMYYDYWCGFKSSNIRKWDISRYLIIAKHGGMYVDVDTIFYKNMSAVLDLNSSLIFVNKIGDDRWIKNYFFLGSSDAPFWKHLMNEIMKTNAKVGVHAHTGGIRLYHSIQSYNKKTKIKEKIQYLNPNFVANVNLKYEGSRIKNFKPENVYIHHLLEGSWC